jgi:REP element-mobilizing transposase RayT
MPNHFHGIIFIGENQYNANIKEYLADRSINKFGPQSKNLASVIRGFKSAVTTYARKNKILFDWQSRFHDHIVRSEAEYYRIAEYITDNPANWSKDEFYPLK